MNYIECVNHIIFSPKEYHKQYSYDTPIEPAPNSWGDIGKRVVMAALPFIGLYRPAGVYISLGMGSIRILSHITLSYNAVEAGDSSAVCQEILQLAWAVFTVASNFLGLPFGSFVTGAMDTLQSLFVVIRSLIRAEYSKAADEGFQLAANVAYIAFMLNGALEYMLIFTLVQAASSIYQSAQEFKQGSFHYIDAGAKVLWSCLRLYQAHEYVQAIQRRNAFLRIAQFQALFDRAVKGRAVRHLVEDDLAQLHQKIDENEVVFKNGTGDDQQMGSHFNGYGKALVKGENLVFRTKVVDGKQVTELDFRINYVFRERLQNLITTVSSLDNHQIQDLLQLAGSHATNIAITQTKFSVGEIDIGPAYKIDISGLGSISVGATSAIPNLYNRVIVTLDRDKTVFDLHELLSFTDLDDALRLASLEDIERLKINHLFHVFAPREALQIERSEGFFDLPIDDLKQKIIEAAPFMGTVFDQYLAAMTPEEILPGRIRWRIRGLADAARANGARALTAAITGAYSSEELFNRVASMLQMGMLSTDTRYLSGMQTTGLSALGDYLSGGSDSVFTQLITDKNVAQEMPFHELFYNGKIRLMVSLDALETGTYQYHYDNFGTRGIGEQYWGDAYSQRPGIMEFIQQQQASDFVFGGNEVMIKERIPPSFFQAIIVPNETTKLNLIAFLRHRKLIAQNEQGTDLIMGKLVDQFIQVSTRVSEELFEKIG